MARLFVALDFPDDVREQIANVCFGVRKAKWVNARQIHLTLRFLGDASIEQYQDCLDMLSEVRVPSFDLSVAGAGFFPPRRRPNVLWLGVEQNPLLTELRNQIDEAVCAAGFEPEERKFHAHVTVARLKEDAVVDDVGAFVAANALFRSRPFTASHFHLYSSVLGYDGAEHTREASFSLLGDNDPDAA